MGPSMQKLESQPRSWKQNPGSWLEAQYSEYWNRHQHKAIFKRMLVAFLLSEMPQTLSLPPFMKFFSSKPLKGP